MKMKQFILLVVFFCAGNFLQAQIHPNFEVVDTDGKTHRLYQDYTSNGVTMVIKVFFVDCPPCNSLAPKIQDLYEKWGEGKYDVQFIEMTTKSGDSNADINGYKQKHSLTFPGVSNSGGAKEVVDRIKSSYFGTYYGTPSFVIIDPDNNAVNIYGDIDELDKKIKATGATGMEKVAENTLFQVKLNWPKNFIPNSDSLNIEIKSSTSEISYKLTPGYDGIVSFHYPSEEIPDLGNPVLHIFYKDATSSGNGLNGSDVILLRKHILGLKVFEDEAYVQAADANIDGKINGNDVVILRKVILGILSDFRNGASSYFPMRNNLPLIIDPGNTVIIDVPMVKMGDFN
jgi:peroxiredoxin